MITEKMIEDSRNDHVVLFPDAPHSAILTVKNLKKILEQLPDYYEITYEDVNFHKRDLYIHNKKLVLAW